MVKFINKVWETLISNKQMYALGMTEFFKNSIWQLCLFVNSTVNYCHQKYWLFKENLMFAE